MNTIKKGLMNTPLYQSIIIFFGFLLLFHIIIGNIEVHQEIYKKIDNLFIYKCKYNDLYEDGKLTYNEYLKILDGENQFEIERFKKYHKK